MATSAMDPNRGAAAPYEFTAGAGRPVSRSLQLIPLSRNGTHQKNERWAEHQPWVAATRWGNITTNHRLVAAAGGGVEEEMKLGRNVW